MDLFQIMCAGGCNNDIGPIMNLIKALFRIIQVFGPIIILLIVLIKIILWINAGKKNKKRVSKKELKNKILKLVIIAILIFFLCTFIEMMFGMFGPKYDDSIQCWCK